MMKFPLRVVSGYPPATNIAIADSDNRIVCTVDKNEIGFANSIVRMANWIGKLVCDRGGWDDWVMTRSPEATKDYNEGRMGHGK